MTEEVDLTKNATGRLMELLAGNDAVEQSLLSTSATFDEMGFDSLILVELAIEIEKVFHLRISASELTACNTIGGIAQRLTERSQYERAT